MRVLHVGMRKSHFSLDVLALAMDGQSQGTRSPPGGVSRFLGESPICPCERPVHGLGGPGLATRPGRDAADSEPRRGESDYRD